MAAAGIVYGANGESVGATQLNPHVFERKALVEAQKEAYFGQLASVRSMPANSGKKIKQYVWIPLLDDANVNDQGINAAGVTIADGNLYGSSKDIGTIPSKLPTLGETGGRVNRVGYTRKEIEGTFANFGFFSEYSQDVLNFDSEADLLTHINRELLNGAMEATEDALQIDLLNAAATLRYSGAATSDATVDATSKITYQDLMQLSIDLDNHRTPKQTTIITGTRNTDTRTLGSTRVAYVGSEMIPTLESMVDLHGRPAFVPSHQYAAGTTLLRGERGSVGDFRFIVVPEMLKWAGKGAAVTDDSFFSTDGMYDIFPVLTVGEESFTTIGFQVSGNSMKFEVIHRKPGKETADKADPYGKMGFISIQWWYGFMALRPERIGLIKTAAMM